MNKLKSLKRKYKKEIQQGLVAALLCGEYMSSKYTGDPFDVWILNATCISMEDLVALGFLVCAGVDEAGYPYHSVTPAGRKFLNE